MRHSLVIIHTLSYLSNANCLIIGNKENKKGAASKAPEVPVLSKDELRGIRDKTEKG